MWRTQPKLNQSPHKSRFWSVMVDDPIVGSEGNGVRHVCEPKREGLPTSVSDDSDGTDNTITDQYFWVCNR
jgi:hypothetical protein